MPVSVITSADTHVKIGYNIHPRNGLVDSYSTDYEWSSHEYMNHRKYKAVSAG